MATPRIQLDPAGLREQVFDVVRQLLAELGSPRAYGTLRGDAHLDRDLGLGSLERVELVVRLSAEFGRELSDTVVAEADTVDDLLAAVMRLGAGVREEEWRVSRQVTPGRLDAAWAGVGATQRLGWKGS